jgi:hypothetical protein
VLKQLEQYCCEQVARALAKSQFGKVMKYRRVHHLPVVSEDG